jgi:hypothetical protein
MLCYSVISQLHHSHITMISQLYFHNATPGYRVCCVDLACMNLACVDLACMNLACVDLACMNLACVDLACMNLACMDLACMDLCLVIDQTLILLSVIHTQEKAWAYVPSTYYTHLSESLGLRAYYTHLSESLGLRAYYTHLSESLGLRAYYTHLPERLSPHPPWCGAYSPS